MPGGQDAAAAAEDDGSSSSRARRAKHRSRSPSTTTGRSPDNLLEQVRAACQTHRETLHTFTHTSSETTKSFAHWRRPTMFANDETLAAAQGDVPRKCSKQMNSLCQVLGRIEENYATRLGKIDRMLEEGHRAAAADAARRSAAAAAEAADDDSDSAAAAAVAQQLSLAEAARELAGRPVGWGADDGDMIQAADLASDLCITYRACLRGSFCPYSLQMFGWGRGGDKVLPRVHLLLQSMLSSAVAVQTLRQIPEDAKAAESAKKSKKQGQGVDASAGDADWSAKSADAEDDRYTLIDAAQTIARLLRSIPERELRGATVRDLVALLYDSAVVIGTACSLPLVRDVVGAFAAESGNHSGASDVGVRLSLFCETLEERKKNASPSDASDDPNQYGDEEYQVDIKSMVTLLSLQRGVMRILSTLLQLHRQDRKFRIGLDEEETDEGQIEIADIEAALQSNGMKYLESASVDDADVKAAILSSLRQILLSPPASSSASAAESGSAEVCALGLLAKIEAARLLQMLWEDLSTLESMSHDDETTDLRFLCCQALLTHFRAMGASSSNDTSSSALTVNIHIISDRYFSVLFDLFCDRVVSSDLFSLDGGGTETTSGRSLLLVPTTSKASRGGMILSTLLQCIKHFPAIVQSSNHSPTEEAKKLCRMILRAVHILLNNSRQSVQQRSLAHSFSSTNEIYPSLVGLTKESSLAPIVIAVVGNLLDQGGIVHGVNHNSVLVDACTVAWQINEERLAVEEEKEQDKNTGAQAKSNVSEKKRQKVSKSRHTKLATAGAVIPKQQLQIELSPKRKRSHADMSSPVPRNSLLSSREYKAGDSSPASSIARILDEALIEAFNITRDANASQKKGEGEKGVNSAVLSSITARSVSTMGGAFNLVIRLSRSSTDSMRCFAVKSTADALLHALTLVANAVKHGAMAPSNVRAVGPNRLKRVLNVLVGVGFQLHVVTTSVESFGAMADDVQEPLRNISQCAVDVWTRNSSLLEQQRDREDDRGRAAASGPVPLLDSFDTSLEHRHAQQERSTHRRCCGGSCVTLFSSFGIAAPEALSARCFCSMLPSHSGDIKPRRLFANDIALFFAELELPLSSRCFLLASICPSKGTQLRSNDEPTPLSSFRTILNTPTGEQADLVVASALACVPFCILTNAQNPGPSGGKVDSKHVIQMITKVGLHRSVSAIAFPTSEGSTVPSYPPALCRAAIACLHRLLKMYVSPPSLEDIGGDQTSIVTSCLVDLESNFSTRQSVREEPVAPPQISSAAFDLLVSPMMTSKQDVPSLPSEVRLALWKFLAFACTVCSPSQLRRSKGHLHLVSSRSSAASGNTLEAGEGDAKDVDEGAASDTVRLPSLLWLVHAAFADEDRIVRDYAAIGFGSALRLETTCNPLFALFLSDTEWQTWAKDPVGLSTKFTRVVVEKLFREVDSLLHKFCYINESQLSYTLAGTITSTVGSASSGGGGDDPSTAARSKAAQALSHQISALRALSSICCQVDLDTLLGKKLFEHSLLHIVRLWINPNSSRVGVPTAVELRVPGGSILASAAWDEICKIDKQCSLRSFLIEDVSIHRYTSTLFSEILVGAGKGSAQDPADIERHIIGLMRFIRAFLVDAIGDKATENQAFANTRQKFIPRRKEAYDDILKFVEIYFPEICATLIVDKDMEALKMFIYFQRFIVDEGSAIRREEKSSKSSGEKIQGGKTWHRSSVIKDVIKKMELSRAMVEFYASPDFAKAALNRVLLTPQSDSLYFYVRTILGDTLSLVQVFQKPYKVYILDQLVSELGKYDIADVRLCLENGPGSSNCSSYSACLALKRLGLIQDLQEKTNDDETDAIGAMKRLGAVQADASRELGLEAAKRMVTRKMMSILVQHFMKEWSDESGLRLIRSLQALLLFVHEEESPAFLTQVQQVINKAMATNSSEMHLVAVSTLSDYVQMVLKQNVKLIGDNLSNIVVTLFPVFEVENKHHQLNKERGRPPASASSGRISNGSRSTATSNNVLARAEPVLVSSDPYLAKAVDEAVKLLNHLVEGKVGKKLSPYFSEIPFLPSNPVLEGVRSSLKKLGVDIDQVVSMSQVVTQRTQDGCTGADRDETGSVSSFVGSSGPSRSNNLGSQAQAALRRRLGVLSKLLAHENKQVRIAVLRHLTDLLRANRALFLHLVESEESVSMRFLTVVKDASFNNEAGDDADGDLASVGRGGVTEIVQKLVSRCIIESDADARLSLATCLGEMGAIDSNRLGREVNATSAALLTNDSFDVSGFHGSWRLSQPPWKSQVIRYELHLVTHQLVMSLKGAKDNMGQHKVAFTIQELLKLLDESAAKLYASTQPQQAKSLDGHASSGGGPGRQRGEMSAWLSGKLEEAGVKEVLEPYWKTQYRQKELLTPRSPPFFVESKSYFGWLRDWCRYMIARAHKSQRSRWKDFFFACRAAIREDSTVCEFLLPLLVLDNLCFDEESDGQAVVKEMLDALTFTDCSSDMPLSERTKACNAVFVVLDTLSLWSEKETEERNRSSRGSSSGSSSSPSMSCPGGADTEWSAEESLASIDDLLKAIPLSACAEAAEAVGMNARSLRYLELEARSHIAGPIYNDLQVDNYRRHYSSDDEFYTFGKKGSLLGKTILKGVDTKVVRKVLGCLGDNATMTAISKDTSGVSNNLLANIQEREFQGDWEGALQMYEQALQLHEAQSQRGQDATKEREALSLRSGMVKCLLELGRLETALNQTKGILSKGGERKEKETTAGTSRKRDRPPSYKSIDEDARKMLMPSAAEAAWRLGRWDALDDIVGSFDSPSSNSSGSKKTDDGNISIEDVDSDSQYGISFGKAMLGLQKCDVDGVSVSLEAARTAALQSLSSAARESYSRAYPYLLRLQCIREVEDANELLRSNSSSTSDASSPLDAANSSADFANLARSQSNIGWEWGGRLRMADSVAQGSSSIINSRLALTRIFDNPILEGELWLNEGKRARKTGLFHIAENSLAHADAAFEAMTEMRANLDPSLALSLNKDTHDVRVQFAKLKAATGKTTAALQLLDQDRIDIKSLLDKDDNGLKEAANKIQILRTTRKKATSGSSYTANTPATLFDENVKIFGRSLLTGTEWICESGLKSASEILDRYDLVAHRLLPRFERSHFCYAKYLDALLTSRIKALSGDVSEGQKGTQSTVDDEQWTKMMRADLGCQKYLLQAMEEYGRALQLGTKHVYQALPRLLSLWFEFTSIDPRPPIAIDDGGGRRRSSSSASVALVDDDRVANQLESMQAKANKQMSSMVRSIPAISFYTALPQLVSRVGHRDGATSDIVITILKRLLVKFPQQTMWSVGWLRNSANTTRAKAGEEIFRGAQKNLREKEDFKKHDLVEASKVLFSWLITVAKHTPKNDKKYFTSKPLKLRGADLSDFVPPVQAALSVLPSSIGHSRNSENFPAFVPRMRAISTKISVMQSKAKPKKITVYAIPAGQSPQLSRSSSSNPHSQPGDAGEMHFLVKQEIRGDLRKDARVQDLNNVINRLLSGHGMSSGNGRGGDGANGAQQQRRRLYLRTFSVTCLSEDCGILEWVPNTDSLRNVISNTYNAQADPHSAKRRGKRIANFADRAILRNYEKIQEIYFKNGNLSKAADVFDEKFLQNYPPVLYWWFVQNFLDPHSWFEARMAFTLSAATWSAVGHVIGLGDRHSENILVDTSSGDCVHVDFDCIFDKALLLPKPEVVPFRLSPNMLDAFGPVGADGAFTGGMVSAMTTLRDNRDILLSVLEPFIKDPIIDWKKHRNQQKQGTKGNAGASKSEADKAKRHIRVIQGRLNGVYNLENPNNKKLVRTDTHAFDQEDDMTHLLPLSVEGQVQKMITEATNIENLVQVYVGWMPWL